MLVPDMAAPEGERVKLLDFGIAKLGADRGEDAMTRKGQLLGTATYMAPEQFQGDGVIDGQSDVYSLAVVMYRMVSGKVPFVSTSGEFGLAALHMHHKHQPLKAIAPESGQWLSDLIDKMLDKDRQKRPTMLEVQEELQAHLNFRPTTRRFSGNIVPNMPLELIVDHTSSGLFAPTTDEVSQPQAGAVAGAVSGANAQIPAAPIFGLQRRTLLIAGAALVAVLGLCAVLLALRFFPRHPRILIPADGHGDATTAGPPSASQNGETGQGTGKKIEIPAASPLPTKGKDEKPRKRFKIIN